MRAVAGWTIVICLLPACRAEEPLVKTLGRNFIRDQKTIWTRPLHVTRHQAQRVVLFSVITAALIATDERSAQALPKGQAPFFSAFTNAGVGAFGATLGGLLFAGKLTGNDHAVETGLLGAEAAADAFVVGEGLKLLTQRQRPADSNGEGHFWSGGYSFPSGHAMITWAMAEVIANEYKDRPVVRIGAYGLATLVSLSRFPARKHFLSDVFAGSAGGLLIGRYVWGAHRDPSRNWAARPMPQLQVDPRTRTYAVGLAWHWR